MERVLNVYKDFLKSAFVLNGASVSIEQAIEWIRQQNLKVAVDVRRIPFSELQLWNFRKIDNEVINLGHDSGKFFSIDGISVRTNHGLVNEWSQPIINQPEIGYLGFIVKDFGGVLHFLMQAKIEPGNVNCVQLSPTLQATKSNYTRAHKGKTPAYLDYFINAKSGQILIDQLQSEQGARFLKKRNRNIIIRVDDEIPLLDNFIWLTLGQIKALMVHDNLINMDTRTVISGIPFGDYKENEIELFNFLNHKSSFDSIEAKFLKSTLLNNKSLHSFDDIIQFITNRKSFYELDVKTIPLSRINDWSITREAIVHNDNKYFRVIAVEVSISNREVMKWTQPMVEPAQHGICAFVCKEIEGVLHFAVQAKLECGNFDIIELAPTVQCLTGNYKNTSQGSLPFLDFILNAKKEQIIYDSNQSEEGGRFYKEQNRNMIVLAGDEVAVELPENYIWMTANQMSVFVKFNNYINIQARSLLAAIRFVV